ncbi:hypothetical protein E8E13_003608 [Curvularia kusanoi]|uniref:Uncharacterized protein n=1 Tax=Curvularia kusanoi TaxID=90978 RepID=A0A9P4W5I2_CURKU|nr:hypothetical protein E8E13_003608 [Curvularia kusanoi]
MTNPLEAAVEPDVLHKRVFVASLIRVLTDAFGAAKDLYLKLKHKSDSDDDRERDESRHRAHDSFHDRRDSHSNVIESLGRHVRWSFDRREKHESDSEDEVVCNASAEVRATYDRAYLKLGESFASGDDTAKIQLQSQIIELQQVLVSIHQDLMLSNYVSIASSHSQLIHLVQTVRASRAAAIQALDLLYQRLLAQPPKKPEEHKPVPGHFPPPPQSPHRSRSSSSSSDSSRTSVEIPVKPTPEPKPKPNPNINKLFCRYALDLQYNPRLPLSNNFGCDGNKKCPHCHAEIPIRPKKAWEVVMETGKRLPRHQKFLVRNEFVVKCHRPGGGFACVLCAKFGEADTVCRSIAALMEHLWKQHTAGDLEKDEDIVGC